MGTHGNWSHLMSGLISLMSVIPSAGSSKMTAADNFDSYADGSTLSGQSNWLKLDPSFSVLEVVNPTGIAGSLQSADGTGPSICYYNAGTWSPDQSAQVTFMGDSANVAVRCASGSGYYAEASLAFGGFVHLRLFAASSFSDLVNSGGGTAPWVPGDVLSIQVSGSGSATRITVSRNGSALISSYDPGSGNYLSTGAPGVGSSNQFTPSTDNWSATDL